jgi:formylglycine-generating enzyme required for sulfatase activity
VIKWVYSNPAGLYFTKSEVTLAQYKACVAAGVCKSDNHGTKSDNKYCNWGYGDRGDHPMNCVKWYGADEFCRWVGGRLPTEDEWYAEASANKTREYPWGNEQATCNYAVMDQGGNGCGRGSTWLVCSKPAGNSVSGLCDMSGNVWEWTSTQEGSARVLRGGSWGNDDPDYLRASGRVWYNPDYRYYYFGFRCVRASR